VKEDLETLAGRLRELYKELRDERLAQWQRSIPFEETLFDRTERAQFLGFGIGTTIYQQSYVYGDVQVADHTWIGPMTILDGTGGLTIGDHCSLATGVQIYTHETVRWALTGGVAPYEYAPVRIGRCCYIGPYAVIAKGVTIADHSVVGAHSFVNADVAAYTVVAGSPAKPIKRVLISEDGTVETVALDAERNL
jgi:acetyltransferase-like isoleucine patch superfamily enzyme